MLNRGSSKMLIKNGIFVCRCLINLQQHQALVFSTVQSSRLGTSGKLQSLVKESPLLALSPLEIHICSCHLLSERNQGYISCKFNVFCKSLQSSFQKSLGQCKAWPINFRRFFLNLSICVSFFQYINNNNHRGLWKSGLPP